MSTNVHLCQLISGRGDTNKKGQLRNTAGLLVNCQRP